MITVNFNAKSLQVVLSAMGAATALERKAAVAAIDSAGRLLRDKIRQNISLRDHSPADLAELDHPYARRHGAIRIHGSGSTAIKDPANRVHTQSGQLLGALRTGATNQGLGYRVDLDTSAAPHAVFVVQGTKVMLPRDVLDDTANAPAVRTALMRTIVTVLGKQFRTQGAVRFGGGAP